MSVTMDEAIKRWTAKRKTALVVGMNIVIAAANNAIRAAKPISKRVA